jgi:hypothetical protein
MYRRRLPKGPVLRWHFADQPGVVVEKKPFVERLVMLMKVAKANWM